MTSTRLRRATPKSLLISPRNCSLRYVVGGGFDDDGSGGDGVGGQVCVCVCVCVWQQQCL